MNDAHTPKLLSEADAAADLAGLPRAVSLPPLPELPDNECIPLHLIRYVPGYTKSFVQEYAIAYAKECCDTLAGHVAELEAERDAAAKRAPDFAEFVDETDSTLEMVKRTFGNRGTPPDMLEGFATLTMVEKLLTQCEQVRAALSTTPESKP